MQGRGSRQSKRLSFGSAGRAANVGERRRSRTVEVREFLPHADKKRVTIKRHCCRESRLDAEEMTVSLLRERPAASRRRRSNRPGNSQADEPRNA